MAIVEGSLEGMVKFFCRFVFFGNPKANESMSLWAYAFGA